MSGLCNLQLKQFSFLYSQTLHNGCSHIEDVHLIFCAHLIFYYILGLLNLDISTSTPPLGLPYRTHIIVSGERYIDVRQIEHSTHLQMITSCKH